MSLVETNRGAAALAAAPSVAGASGGGGANGPEQRQVPQRRAGRTATALLLIVSLVATALLQGTAQKQHARLVKPTGSSATVNNLDSFSLSLLLGGLRGPLVMFLWPSAEMQKHERDLEDFDTKIELIRLLQAEYDSVHLFQIWNKAYNVSVQMANLPNKYVTILDAVEYANRIDRQHPDDLNIVVALGQLYFDKLGSSAEKAYYRRRVCAEVFSDVTLTFPAKRVPEFQAVLRELDIPESRARMQTVEGEGAGTAVAVVDKLIGDRLRARFEGEGVRYEYAKTAPRTLTEAGRRIRQEPWLLENGMLRPEVLNATRPRPADLPPDAEWNDGSEMQYLARYQPFPYGISPMAIGYNYLKRAQVLRQLTQQKHLQLSDMVVDNRPVVALKWWAESEAEAGRTVEFAAFGMSMPKEKAGVELGTAAIAPDAAAHLPIGSLASLDEAAYWYDMCARIAADSGRQFENHMRHYAVSATNYNAYRDNLNALQYLCLGDRDYLRALRAPAQERRRELLRAAAGSYREAANRYRRVALVYYADEFLGAIGLAKPAVRGASDEQLAVLWGRLLQVASDPRYQLTNRSEEQEVEASLQRINIRLEKIGPDAH